MEISGPAAAFIDRPSRYGARLARVMPARVRVPGWRLDTDVRRDGALVRFRTPGRPRAVKARKVATANLDHLILVVYRGLAVGGALDALTSTVGMERVIWFTDRPRASDVVRAAEQWARR